MATGAAILDFVLGSDEMLHWLVDKSLALPKAVAALAIAVLALGVWQLPQAKVDALPEFAPVTVQIQTEALGLSAQEVEQMITVPLEQDLLNGVAWVEHIHSESVPGLSKIDMTFERGTDPLKARQVVQERMTQAHALPNVSAPPQMIQPVSAAGRVAMIGISSKSLSPIELGVLARWTIRPKLMGVPGVANVAIWGQRERQVQVQVDPDKLRQKGVTLEQVVHTTGNALLVSPLSFLEASTPGTGGFVDTPNQRLGVQHMVPIHNADELAEVVLEDSATQTRLGDVTTVVEEHQPLIGDARLATGNGFLIVVDKFPGQNTSEIAAAVEEAMETMAPGLTGVTVDTSVYRPATYVEQVTGNLRTAGLLGAALALIVLFALLLSWRRTLVTFVAATLSLGSAALILHLFGRTLDGMVTLGLAAALVAAIYDGVSSAEAMSHRRGMEDAEAHGRIRSGAVASGRVIAYGTVIVAAACLPLIFLNGLPAGAFTTPFALTLLLALGTSLLVAVTVTPALCALLHTEGPESAVARHGQRAHRRGMAALLRRPVAALAAAGVGVLGLAAFALPGVMDRSLMPTMREPHLLVQWNGAAGTSLAEMSRVGARVTEELRSVEGVSGVGSHFGRAVTSDTHSSANGGMLWLTIAEDADYDRTVEAVQEVVAGYPGLEREVLTYSTERVSQYTTGSSSPVTVRLYGEDMATLREQATKVHALLGSVDGVANPVIASQAQEPTIQIDVDLAKAREHGVKPGDVRRAATTLLSGIHVGSLFDQQKVFDVQVWSAPEVRENVSDVSNLVLDTPGGKHIKLSDVATVSVAPSPTSISHDGVSRRIDVTADVSGRSLNAVLGDVKGALKNVALPMEYHAEVLGDYVEQKNAERGAMVLGAFALLVVFLLLQSAFESWRLAALTLLTLPLCLLGGPVAARLTGAELTLATVAGLLAILALAVRASLRLVTRARELTGHTSPSDAYAAASAEHAMPVVVTAAVAAAALLPVLVLGPRAGLESLQPFAVVVLGGLVTTVLTVMLVLPALCGRYATRANQEAASAPLPPTSPAVGRG